jgi:hypothetical protein
VLLRLIGIVVVIYAIFWAYGNLKIDNIDICVAEEEILLPITCLQKDDCTLYLTSSFTEGYPRTELFTSILEDTASCVEGHCYLKTFDFRDNMANKRCMQEQMKLTYKVTSKDILAIKEG